jgi:hypothetical protein
MRRRTDCGIPVFLVIVGKDGILVRPSRDGANGHIAAEKKRLWALPASTFNLG